MIDNNIDFTGLVARGDKAINERYRPCTFHEVIGNDKTKKSLVGWMEKGNKRSAALLLHGASGCCKTTTARILAMGLNCEQGDTVNPCCKCPSCKSALAGDAMHITEYNMSALSKKEDADEIVNSMYNSSFTGRNNIYILDECLHYNTSVDCLVNGKVKKIKIGHIVHKKMNVDVFSYNHEKQIIEAKPIVNWFKNPKKEVYEWVFEREQELGIPYSKKILTCTDNHTVFLRDTNQEVQINTLKKGDIIRGNYFSGNFVECGYRFIEKRYNPKKNQRGHVYDIEVADNHNYFASEINVHNCQGMSNSSQNLMLKILENPPSNTYIILATTQAQKILKTVKTRCEQYEFNNPTYDDIKKMLSSVVKQEMPEMNVEQRKQILEACKGFGFREILMKLEKFIKGGGTEKIEEIFQFDYVNIAKLLISGNYLEILNQINKNENDFDVQAARRLIRTFLSNQMDYSMKNNQIDKVKSLLMAFRLFDKGFYLDPNPLPSFKADLLESCFFINKK